MRFFDKEVAVYVDYRYIMLKYIIYFAFGAASGVLGGMGMGGGTLLIPLLTLFTEIDQRQAQLYNLTAFIPMALISLKIHSSNGLVEKKGILSIVVAAMAFSVVGSLVATFTDEDLLSKIFGCFLIAVAVLLFIKELSLISPKR